MWISRTQQSGCCGRSHYVNQCQQVAITGGLSFFWRLIAWKLLYVLIDHWFTLILHPLIFSLCPWPGSHRAYDLTYGSNLYTKRPSWDALASWEAPMQIPSSQTIAANLFLVLERRGTLWLPSFLQFDFQYPKFWICNQSATARPGCGRISCLKSFSS